MAGGFSEAELLRGAAIEHTTRHPKEAINRVREGLPFIQDDPSDAVANIIGMHMYKTQTLSTRTLLWWIYIYKEKLNRGTLDEYGEPIFVPPN